MAASGYTMSRTISASSLDGQVLARAHVDVLGLVVVAHQEDAGVGQVVHVEELAPRRPRPPDLHLPALLELGLVELPDEGGQHV